MILIQAIRNAVVNDLVVRNAADLAAVPTGTAGRPSRSLSMLSVEQALAVPHAAEGERLWTLVVYGLQLRPVLPAAAIALGPLSESRRTTDGGQT